MTKHYCTRCHKALTEKNAGNPDNWLTYDLWHDIYRHYEDVIPAALEAFPEMADMSNDEREDYMLEKQYHQGAFVFGPECVKKVAGRDLSELMREDEGKKTKGLEYWLS